LILTSRRIEDQLIDPNLSAKLTSTLYNVLAFCRQDSDYLVMRFVWNGISGHYSRMLFECPALYNLQRIKHLGPCRLCW